MPLKKQKQYKNNPPQKNKTGDTKKNQKPQKKNAKSCAAGDMAPPPAARCRYRLFLRSFFWIFVFSGVSVLFFFGCIFVLFLFFSGTPCLYEPPWGVPCPFYFWLPREFPVQPKIRFNNIYSISRLCDTDPLCPLSSPFLP